TGEGGRAEIARHGPALHGRALGGAQRPQHLHGDGQQRAGGLELVGLLAGPRPDGLCRGGRPCRRQRAGGAGGQPVARQGATGHQRPVGRARGDDRREHGRTGHRAGRGAGETRAYQAGAERALSAATPELRTTYGNLTPARRAERGKDGRMARKASIIGGGVIGGGWAARFLLNGWDVAVFDPDPEAERKIGEVLANARRSLPALSDVPMPA